MSLFKLFVSQGPENIIRGWIINTEKFLVDMEKVSTFDYHKFQQFFFDKNRIFRFLKK